MIIMMMLHQDAHSDDVELLQSAPLTFTVKVTQLL